MPAALPWLTVSHLTHVVPRDLDDVAVGIKNLDGRVPRLVRPVVLGDAKRTKACSRLSDGGRIGERNPDMELPHSRRRLTMQKSERHPVAGADNESVGLRTDASLEADDITIEAQRALRIGNGQRNMRETGHRDSMAGALA